MDEYHRCMIQRNMESLVAQADLTIVCNTLHRKGVFNDRMATLFKDGPRPEHERKRDMFDYVMTRGPYAFQHLVQTFVETGHSNLARSMEPYGAIQNRLQSSPEDDVDKSVPRHCHPTSLPQYMRNEDPDIDMKVREIGNNIPDAEINLGTTPDTIVVKMGTERQDYSYKEHLHIYPMGTRPKGLFLLINIINFSTKSFDQRDGAEVDHVSILSLFDQLGYHSKDHKNLEYKDLMSTVRDFAQIASSIEANSLVVCIMSHGVEVSNVTHIVAQDGALLSTDEILEEFTGLKCPGMINKPKIFIFQTCRGEKKDKAIRPRSLSRTQDTVTDGVPIQETPVKKAMGDMFVAHSTLPGFVSMRDRKSGTWFIQEICLVFQEHARDTSLEDMFKMVNAKISTLETPDQLKQTSCYENRGFHKFFFNPGLYDNDMDVTDNSVLDELMARTLEKKQSQESATDRGSDSSNDSQQSN